VTADQAGEPSPGNAHFAADEPAEHETDPRAPLDMLGALAKSTAAPDETSRSVAVHTMDGPPPLRCFGVPGAADVGGF